MGGEGGDRERLSASKRKPTDEHGLAVLFICTPPPLKNGRVRYGGHVQRRSVAAPSRSGAAPLWVGADQQIVCFSARIQFRTLSLDSSAVRNLYFSLWHTRHRMWIGCPGVTAANRLEKHGGIV